jgi:hypothetical protein
MVSKSPARWEQYCIRDKFLSIFENVFENVVLRTKALKRHIKKTFIFKMLNSSKKFTNIYFKDHKI